MFITNTYKHIILGGNNTVTLASATFGLVMGSIIGGPIGKRLIEKNNLSYPLKINSNTHDQLVETEESNEKPLRHDNFMGATTQILLAMGLGTIISIVLEETGMTFPSYIGAMFAAAILTILTVLFCYFVTFNVMGRDYDAAVIVSGNCGFSMGAITTFMNFLSK
ncbi:sodium/glutamate symporter [Clostridium estertheticum]|uniref:sodium/glutamate symporter n=1 Tax=Clostridium estertheticum TaxID=238834 RepID=UPI001CF15DBD|nr:sodium/glutamate symporter [Clostridium estertheticum]MCB2358347.1 hypothetical protein [Clostridium estertheticum]